MNLSEINNRLVRIEQLLERLIVPIEIEKGRQLITASPEQRKAHNKSILAGAKTRRIAQ